MYLLRNISEISFIGMKRKTTKARNRTEQNRFNNCSVKKGGGFTFNDPEEYIFENIVGKGENVGYQHFLLFPRCFLLCQRQEIIISVRFDLSPAVAGN